MGRRGVAPEELEGVSTHELLNELKRRHSVFSRPPLHAAVLGPPCVGKSTQAEAVRRAFGVCRVTLADLYKEDTSGTASGSDERAFKHLEVILDKPQCRRGFVLEGFPQTAAQAQRLQSSLKRRTPLEHVVVLDAPEEILQERCRGSLVHEASGRHYHDKFKQPFDEGLDDYTGEALVRPPNKEAQLPQNLERYKADADLLHQFYTKTSIVRNVDATGSIEEVGAAMFAAFG